MELRDFLKRPALSRPPRYAAQKNTRNRKSKKPTASTSP